MSQAPPISTSAPQSSATRWFVAVGKEKQGPFDDAVLRQKIAEGAIQPDQRLWRKGMILWERSKSIPEVQAIHEVVAQDAVRIAQERKALDLANAGVKRWYVAVDKKPTGPYSDDDLVSEVAEGRVQSRTKLWRKGQEGWIHSSQIAELAHVRERGLLQAELVSNLPPAIIGESVYVDPTVQAAQTAQAMQTAPKAPPVQSAAAASPPPLPLTLPLPAQLAVKSPVSTQSLPETVFLSPEQASPVPIRMKTVHVVNDACGAVEKLFPGNQRVMGVIKSLRSAMHRDLMTGNGFGLDKGIEALGAFVQVAAVKSPDAMAEVQGEPSLPVQALMSLNRLHESAAKQVKNLNRSNMLADRTITSFAFGVRPRPPWGVAPSF